MHTTSCQQKKPQIDVPAMQVAWLGFFWIMSLLSLLCYSESCSPISPFYYGKDELFFPSTPNIWTSANVQRGLFVILRDCHGFYLNLWEMNLWYSPRNTSTHQPAVEMSKSGLGCVIAVLAPVKRQDLSFGWEDPQSSKLLYFLQFFRNKKIKPLDIYL